MTLPTPVLRRPRALIALAAAAAVVAAGVTIAALRHNAPPQQAVLHVGDQRGSIHSLLLASGELDHVPYRIDWAEFPVGAPLVEAMKAGAVDFGYVGSATMTFGLVSGAPLKAINVWWIRGGGSGVLVPAGSAIRSVAELRGRRIAVVRGSPGHLLVIKALKRAGVPLDAVTLVNLSAGDAKAALSGGSVDAWAIWDPYLAIGERQDHDRVLTTSGDQGDEVETGVATEAAIAAKRSQLLDFMERVRRAQAWAQVHPAEMARAYASDTGVPLDIALEMRQRSKIEVLPRITDAAVASHQQAADIYADIGLIPHRVDVSQVYDRSFVLGGAS